MAQKPWISYSSTSTSPDRSVWLFHTSLAVSLTSFYLLYITNMFSWISSSLICIVPIVVPEYLQGRPKQTILHCLHRLASSNKFTHSDVTQAAPNGGKFTVKSKKGSHTVEFKEQSGEPKCTCKDWLAYHLPCKHFFAVFRHFSEWGWEKLPDSYLTSPYLSSVLRQWSYFKLYQSRRASFTYFWYW